MPLEGKTITFKVSNKEYKGKVLRQNGFRLKVDCPEYKITYSIHIFNVLSVS
jgi:hypothetical protein